jgi:hypothetical protein
VKVCLSAYEVVSCWENLRRIKGKSKKALLDQINGMTAREVLAFCRAIETALEVFCALARGKVAVEVEEEVPQ